MAGGPLDKITIMYCVLLCNHFVFIKPFCKKPLFLPGGYYPTCPPAPHVIKIDTKISFPSQVPMAY